MVNTPGKHANVLQQNDLLRQMEEDNFSQAVDVKKCLKTVNMHIKHLKLM